MSQPSRHPDSSEQRQTPGRRGDDAAVYAFAEAAWKLIKRRKVVIASVIAALGAVPGAAVWVSAQLALPPKVQELESRVGAIEKAMDALEARWGVVDAMALSTCLAEQNAIARRELDCGQREAQAGIRR